MSDVSSFYDWERENLKPEQLAEMLAEIYDRLAEIEDKIMGGTLVELPCKVGDTATAIIDTLLYDNSIQNVKIKGLAYIVEDENGDTTFQHISRVFHNKSEAEARLKELQEEQECR